MSPKYCLLLLTHATVGVFASQILQVVLFLYVFLGLIFGKVFLFLFFFSPHPTKM